MIQLHGEVDGFTSGGLDENFQVGISFMDLAVSVDGDIGLHVLWERGVSRS